MKLLINYNYIADSIEMINIMSYNKTAKRKGEKQISISYSTAWFATDLIVCSRLMVFVKFRGDIGLI
jgi:hypothetical protein